MEPKPARHVPIWLGTFGPRALRLTGRLADGWIPSPGFAPPEAIRRCETQSSLPLGVRGVNPEDITCAYSIEINIDGPSEQPPSVVAGSPEQVVERLLSFIDLGFTAMNFTLVDRARVNNSSGSPMR